MAKITFKAKIKTLEYSNGEIIGRRIQCPELKRRHCDMHSFRIHPRYGGYANSDLFPAILKRLRAELFGSCGIVKLEALPANVAVDESGFLAKVTITV